MNLAQYVAPGIEAVNPKVPLQVRFSAGATQDASFNSVPSYSAPVVMMGQVQPLQYRDIMQAEGLNIQGTRQKVYLFGTLDALKRVNRKGGDLITDTDGNVWLTAIVVEQWPDWVSAIVTLQNGQ